MKTGAKPGPYTRALLVLRKGDSLLIPDLKPLDAARATARNHGLRISYRKQEDGSGYVVTMKGRRA